MTKLKVVEKYSSIAKQECARQGMRVISVLAAKQHNPRCPSDDFLGAVLIHREHDHTPFVVWAVNTQAGSLFYGEYCSSLEVAQKVFNEKGFGGAA
jgi:hypothetical protein